MAIFAAIFMIDTLHITPEILALVAQIDEFKGAWRVLGSLAPERLLALRRVATIESVASSTRIEGRLVKKGHLVKHGIGRGTWYVASGQ